ncbi:RagB/SusD family nutrient uptake outer membrane protein [Pedobacter riviphilus]|uniref:RagB/SusD family nutrient uptake outer membrane protein n=1 Tax=Pedobacter riviphilus TaxID=2766984 RepID=A0ABX6THM1_9SPHI|nr:RagB/SusD family nutrient uptake outer membrane protein [Pedobacter riviphilus]QNR84114.1 RagB/SusD family nutrient uptake outer membrane protein [Pedobacter riviphilus]
MKNKIIFAALAIGLTIFSSCEKQLDVNPVSAVAPEAVGPADAPKLLNGIYDALQSGNTSFYYLSYATEDLSADNLVYRATFFQHGEIDNNAILTNNVLVARYFIGPYAIIQRANDLLEILNSGAVPDATKKPLLTQTYFLRAYAYYRLVTLFGPVPIVFNRDVVKVPRKSQDEVYNQIIADLKASIDAGTDFTDAKFASIQASKALLARVYLIRKNYPLAKQYADEVINSGKFQVTSNYASIFTTPYVSTEHIFKLNFTATEAQQSLDFFLQHPSMPGGGRAELPVDQSLVNAYEAGDTRKAASIQEVLAPTANPGWYCKKYQDPSGNGALPFSILRISEMYLISGEAQFMISNSGTDAVALSRINDVRTKRGLGALATVSLQSFIRERRVELAFEGTRWTDMKRAPSTTNPAKSMATVFLEAKGRTINDELYPIPQDAITTNDLLLPNNPGYN